LKRKVASGIMLTVLLIGMLTLAFNILPSKPVMTSPNPDWLSTNITLTAHYNGPYYELNVASSPLTGVTFTLNGTPQTTSYTDWLLEGSYTLEMPQTHDEYVWFHWLEDGDTNRTKTFVLADNTTWTGVYRFIADLNGDGVINIVDIVLSALAFDSRPGDHNWNPIADLNQDGIINIIDLVKVAIHFGETFARALFEDGFENDFTPWTGTVGTPEIPILKHDYFLDGYDTEAEIDVYGVIGNELFFAQNWLTSNTGWILKADLTTLEKTVLYTGNKLAMWEGAIDGSVCWAAGEDKDSGGIWRSAIGRATTSGASVAKHPNTGDCNEFIGFMDDGTQLVAGERKPGGLTEGSSYPNGCGLWTIPKSTWSDTGTWSRVYEDTDLYEWGSIAKFGSTYYALLAPYNNGKWKVMKSASLTTWTVDLDYRGQTLTYDYGGQLIHLGNKLAVISPVQSDSKWHLFVLSTEGGSWTDYSINIALASESAYASAYYDSTIGRIILLIGRDTTKDHTIYSIKTDGTDLRTERTNLQGTNGAFTPRMYEYCYKDGAVYYPICFYTSSTSYIGKISRTAHHGSRSMVVDLDATEYAYKTLASSYSNLFVRFYVQVTNLPAPGAERYQDFIVLRDSGGTARLYAGYWLLGSSYRWYLNVDGSGDVIYEETINPNQWYCIEVEFDANADVHYLWRDGVQIITVNQATANTIQRVDVGSCGGSGNWAADGCFDCVVVADTYIQPEGQQ